MRKILNLEEVEQIAKDILEKINKKINKGATVIAFYGDLGAGKTTITKEIAKQLGILVKVVSPTFVIMKIYKTKNDKYKNMVHIDAYRLDKSKELLNLGFNEMLKDKDNLIVIEWPERVEDCLPSNTHKIKLDHKDDTKRVIKF